MYSIVLLERYILVMKWWFMCSYSSDDVDVCYIVLYYIIRLRSCLVVNKCWCHPLSVNICHVNKTLCERHSGLSHVMCWCHLVSWWHPSCVIMMTHILCHNDDTVIQLLWYIRVCSDLLWIWAADFYSHQFITESFKTIVSLSFLNL